MLPAMPPAPIPKLPRLLERKIYKTGQTRGADDDEIFQNRVNRSGTVLISYPYWDSCRTIDDGSNGYENGFIVLISPREYFSHADIIARLSSQGLVIGTNALVFYETRSDWERHNPDALGWQSAESRTAPLGGQYVARISATTAEDGEKITKGFSATSNKGAGIRVYEYASTARIQQCRLQLEALFWLCNDSVGVVSSNGMVPRRAEERKTYTLGACQQAGLLDYGRLRQARMLNSRIETVCPLCLEPLSSQGFLSRMEQAEGREVLDLTITQVNLFHISELRVGVLNHRPYNLGWGHHHCNVVVKDSGIDETLKWMRAVLRRNDTVS